MKTSQTNLPPGQPSCPDSRRSRVPPSLLLRADQVIELPVNLAADLDAVAFQKFRYSPGRLVGCEDPTKGPGTTR